MVACFKPRHRAFFSPFLHRRLAVSGGQILPHFHHISSDFIGRTHFTVSRLVERAHVSSWFSDLQYRLALSGTLISQAELDFRMLPIDILLSFIVGFDLLEDDIFCFF
jgi:hypothetical protein